MLLLEHDAKTLLEAEGVAVPDGVLAARGGALPAPGYPCMVKAQVATGGRGRAGGIRRVERPEDLAAAVAAVTSAPLRGLPVTEVRIERCIDGATERYASLSLDPESAGVAVVLAETGGVDVEDQPAARLAIGRAALDPAAIDAEIARLAARLPAPAGPVLAAAARRLAAVFLARELTLLEINPLFARPDGSWIAGDARIAFDDGAFPRQPALRALLARRADAYPVEAFKQAEGFDFVTLDPAGAVGLVTTGAGLSLQIVDELAERGVSARNFCDIRSGMMRGDPSRLVAALGRLAEGGPPAAVLVNIFAGITHLGEFARLLVDAIGRTGAPAPVVARLVGNGAEEAAAILADVPFPCVLEPDLDRALDRVAALAGTG